MNGLKEWYSGNSICIVHICSKIFYTGIQINSNHFNQFENLGFDINRNGLLLGMLDSRVVRQCIRKNMLNLIIISINTTI